MIGSGAPVPSARELVHERALLGFHAPRSRLPRSPVDFVALGRLYDRLSLSQQAVADNPATSPYYALRARGRARRLCVEAMRCFRVARAMEAFP